MSQHKTISNFKIRSLFRKPSRKNTSKLPWRKKSSAKTLSKKYNYIHVHFVAEVSSKNLMKSMSGFAIRFSGKKGGLFPVKGREVCRRIGSDILQ